MSLRHAGVCGGFGSGSGQLSAWMAPSDLGRLATTQMVMTVPIHDELSVKCLDGFAAGCGKFFHGDDKRKNRTASVGDQDSCQTPF